MYQTSYFLTYILQFSNDLESWDKSSLFLPRFPVFLSKSKAGPLESTQTDYVFHLALGVAQEEPEDILD